MKPALNETDLMAQYIKLRDTVEKLNAEHALKIAPYEQGMDAILGAMTTRLLELGPDEGKRHITTSAGTAFRQKWTSVKVEDREPWLDFVFNIDGQQFLTNHVSKDAVLAWMEEHNGALPPGIKFEAGYKTIIRRS